MIERIWNRVRHEKPLRMHGEAAVLAAAFLQREVTVRNPDGSLLLRGRAKKLNPEGGVILTNCRRYSPCRHGLHGLDVFEVGAVKVGIERVELEI